MSKRQGSDTSRPAPDLKDATPAAKPKKAKPAESSSGDDKGFFTKIADKVIGFKEYVSLSWTEMHKVSWPTWKETRATSIVVFAFVAVMALLLSLVDLALSGIIRWILS